MGPLQIFKRAFYESRGSGCHFAGLMAALHPLPGTAQLVLRVILSELSQFSEILEISHVFSLNFASS